MEKNITDIISTISEVYKDVYDYITGTEHWLFYWIDNKEVQDFIDEYPEDFEDLVSLDIRNLGNSCTCCIKFENHPFEIDHIERFCVLATFRDSAKTKWMQWNGRIRELKMSKLKEELEYYKKMVMETEDKIKELGNCESGDSGTGRIILDD